MIQAGSVLIDVRSADFYRGKKQDEARGDHIPHAINRLEYHLVAGTTENE